MVETYEELHAVSLLFFFAKNGRGEMEQVKLVYFHIFIKHNCVLGVWVVYLVSLRCCNIGLVGRWGEKYNGETTNS